ncbi:MAG: hypothetical protein IKJ36_04650 [Clostridia bacterium]|nr:hypothetical protein [Clostridia bacterium]
MNELAINIIINIIVGICVFVGFFIFFGNSNGWFKKGGLVYEWWRKKKAKKKLEKRSAERAKYAQKRKAKTSNNDPIQHK